MCLAQGHNAVTPVQLEPATFRSRAKHSTTESMRSLLCYVWSQPTLIYLAIHYPMAEVALRFKSPRIYTCM